MSASLSDLLTAAKNIVTALNLQAQNAVQLAGQQALTAISAATLVFAGGGRAVAISVTTAGSAAGAVYDANNVASTSNPIYTIPNTVGVYVLGVPVSNGLVIAPGTGQKVTVVYSIKPSGS